MTDLQQRINKLHEDLAVLKRGFDHNQARDERGRWSGGGGGFASGANSGNRLLNVIGGTGNLLIDSAKFLAGNAGRWATMGAAGGAAVGLLGQGTSGIVPGIGAGAMYGAALGFTGGAMLLAVVVPAVLGAAGVQAVRRAYTRAKKGRKSLAIAKAAGVDKKAIAALTESEAEVFMNELVSSLTEAQARKVLAKMPTPG